MRSRGRNKPEKKQFWPDLIGFKYKMSNIQAAIGCAQIERIEALIKKKRQIFAFYCNHVAEMPGVRINPQPNGTINGAWMPTVIFDEETGVTREKLLSAFTHENIDARVIFWPLSSLPMFESARGNKNSWSIPSRGINLPSYSEINKNELKRVVKVLKFFGM